MKSRKQALAIGLSEARAKGAKVPRHKKDGDGRLEITHDQPVRNACGPAVAQSASQFVSSQALPSAVRLGLVYH